MKVSLTASLLNKLVYCLPEILDFTLFGCRLLDRQPLIWASTFASPQLVLGALSIKYCTPGSAIKAPQQKSMILMDSWASKWCSGLKVHSDSIFRGT